MLILVLRPLLGRMACPLEDVAVLLDEVVRSLPRPGGLPRDCPLRFVVLGCVENWSGFWLEVLPFPLASCGCSVSTKRSGPLGFPVQGPNTGKLLSLSVRDGLSNNGAEVPEGDGIKLSVGDTSGRISS